MVIRSLSHNHIDSNSYREIVDQVLIISTTFLQDEATSKETKGDLKYQLKWVYDSYLTQNTVLGAVLKSMVQC
jgi:hypothetical protein